MWWRLSYRWSSRAPSFGSWPNLSSRSFSFFEYESGKAPARRRRSSGRGPSKGRCPAAPPIAARPAGAINTPTPPGAPTFIAAGPTPAPTCITKAGAAARRAPFLAGPLGPTPPARATSQAGPPPTGPARAPARATPTRQRRAAYRRATLLPRRAYLAGIARGVSEKGCARRGPRGPSCRAPQGRATGGQGGASTPSG